METYYLGHDHEKSPSFASALDLPAVCVPAVMWAKMKLIPLQLPGDRKGMRAIKSGSINCTAEAVSGDSEILSRASASEASVTSAELEVDEDRDRGSRVASVDSLTDSPSIRNSGAIVHVAPKITHVSPSLLPAIDPSSRAPVSTATTSSRRQLDFPDDADVTTKEQKEVRPSESWDRRDLPAASGSDADRLSSTWDDMWRSTMTPASESRTSTSQAQHSKSHKKRKKKKKKEKGQTAGRQGEGSRSRESVSHEDQGRSGNGDT